MNYRCELLQAWSQHKSDYFNGEFMKYAPRTLQRPSPISRHPEMRGDGLQALTHVQVVLAGVIQHLPKEAERKLDNEKKIKSRSCLATETLQFIYFASATSVLHQAPPGAQGGQGGGCWQAVSSHPPSGPAHDILI